MPIFTYVVVVGSALIALLFVMDVTLEKGVSPIITSERQGLPKPWHPDPIQVLTATPAPAPDMTSGALLAAQPKVAPAAEAKSDAAPKKKRVTRRQPPDQYRQSYGLVARAIRRVLSPLLSEGAIAVYWVSQFLLLMADNTLISRCGRLQTLDAWCWERQCCETIGDSGADRPLNAHNVLGEPLEICSMRPMTGFHRDGRCNTGREDVGSHTVCAVMTAAFLDFSKSRGNDLSTPVPELGFLGLNPGDRWCLCAPRWQEALEAKPCGLARHARGSLVLLRVRRSQTPSCGFGVN